MKKKTRKKRRTTEQVIRDEMKNGKIKIVYGWENRSCGDCGLTIDEGFKKYNL